MSLGASRRFNTDVDCSKKKVRIVEEAVSLIERSESRDGATVQKE